MATTLLRPIIFNETINRMRWKSFNFNEVAHYYQCQVGYPLMYPRQNPFLDMTWKDGYLKWVAESMETDFLFGGFDECRGDLFRGHAYYGHRKRVRHRGIDLWVPAGTDVYMPRSGEVIHVLGGDSPGAADLDGGWGGTLFFAMDEPYDGARYLIYGHLSQKDLPAVGTRFIKGDWVGRLGKTSENGGWSPHLHVQLFDEAYRRRYAPALEDMDGYGPSGLPMTPHIKDPTGLVMETV